ncbi:MAG: hypothetical protein ACI9HK_000551 [Pirellulaceae bacterium]|jgi:hypothetical protein
MSAIGGQGSCVEYVKMTGGDGAPDCLLALNFLVPQSSGPNSSLKATL